MKEDTSNTEQSILKAAEKEFLKKGFSGSKTTEIAKEAGVTHAMLHYYFRTKENLFNKVFEEKARQLADTFLSRVDECGKEFCRKTLFPNFRLAISLLDRSLQEEIKKGTIRPVKAEDLMVSAISLNIFVFVANPLIQLFVEEKGEEYHQYMERRKQENVEIILSRLRI